MYFSIRHRIISCILIIMMLMTTATAFAQENHPLALETAPTPHNPIPFPDIINETADNQNDEDNVNTSDTPEPESAAKNEDAVHAMVKIFNGFLNFGNKVKNHISKEPSPSIYINQNVTITERIPAPPLINQFDYPKDPYGRHGSIASHGCGISSVTMLYSYLLDTELDIVEMAKTFGKFNTPVGSSWSLFKNTAAHFNIPEPICTYNRKEVIQALKNGQMVISLQSGGLFTDGGHFILLTGITEEGKITVNDSNGWNYTKNSTLSKGFAHGFAPNLIFANGGPYWIYEAKDIDITTLNDERVTVTYEIQVIEPKEASNINPDTHNENPA